MEAERPPPLEAAVRAPPSPPEAAVGAPPPPPEAAIGVPPPPEAVVARRPLTEIPSLPVRPTAVARLASSRVHPYFHQGNNNMYLNIT